MEWEFFRGTFVADKGTGQVDKRGPKTFDRKMAGEKLRKITPRDGK